MKLVSIATLLITLYAGLASVGAQEQNTAQPYAEGTVWELILVRVKPGMLNAYLRDIGPKRNALVDEAKKQGLILSSRILHGSAASKDDWNLIILNEYKNWAAFDGLTGKFQAIANKLIGSEQTQTASMVKRGELREIIGSKAMQELIPNR